jgi:RsiW-degrading membrane proteinase PrsW (M82 family)
MLVLTLLLFISALPVIAAFLWFRRKKFPIPAYWFLLCLLAGAAALPLAALAQYFIPSAPRPVLSDFLFNVFVRIAFTEEAGKLAAVFILLRLGGRFLNQSVHSEIFAHGTAAGLVAGLGFALIESATYGASDLRVALLRAFTAAPLHGACGARVGSAASLIGENTGAALRRFLMAVAIHGTYNMLVVSAGGTRYLSLLLCVTALLSATRELKIKNNRRSPYDCSD